MDAIEASTRAVRMVAGEGEGRVHSVFRRCFNVVQSPSEWLTVAIAPFPRVPDGIIVASQCSTAWPRIVPGAVVRWSAEVLSVPDADLTIRIAPARVYDLRRQPLMPRFQFVPLERNLATAWAILEHDGCADGLGWARRALRWSEPDALRAANECPVALCRRAVPSIIGLREAIRTDDPDIIEREIRSLLGFGIGLTPSGDDLLGGLAAGLYLGGVPETERGFVSLLRAALWGGDLTTEISAQALRRIVDGEIADIIFDVGLAIVRKDEPEVAHAMATLLAYGATSGTETAMGLCLGLQLAVEHSCPYAASGDL